MKNFTNIQVDESNILTWQGLILPVRKRHLREFEGVRNLKYARGCKVQFVTHLLSRVFLHFFFTHQMKQVLFREEKRREKCVKKDEKLLHSFDLYTHILLFIYIA